MNIILKTIFLLIIIFVNNSAISIAPQSQTSSKLTDKILQPFFISKHIEIEMVQAQLYASSIKYNKKGFFRGMKIKSSDLLYIILNGFKLTDAKKRGWAGFHYSNEPKGAIYWGFNPHYHTSNFPQKDYLMVLFSINTNKLSKELVNEGVLQGYRGDIPANAFSAIYLFDAKNDKFKKINLSILKWAFKIQLFFEKISFKKNLTKLSA